MYVVLYKYNIDNKVPGQFICNTNACARTTKLQNPNIHTHMYIHVRSHLIQNRTRVAVCSQSKLIRSKNGAWWQVSQSRPLVNDCNSACPNQSSHTLTTLRIIFVYSNIGIYSPLEFCFISHHPSHSTTATSLGLGTLVDAQLVIFVCFSLLLSISVFHTLQRVDMRSSVNVDSYFIWCFHY